MQRISTQPPSQLPIVHPRTVIQPTQTSRHLILLAVVLPAATSVYVTSRNPVPASKRVIIITFFHRSRLIHDYPHATQVIRQKITDFIPYPARSVRHDSPSCKQTAFKLNVTAISHVCQRTQVAKTVVTTVNHSQLRTIGKIAVRGSRCIPCFYHRQQI